MKRAEELILVLFRESGGGRFSHVKRVEESRSCEEIPGVNLGPVKRVEGGLVK